MAEVEAVVVAVMSVVLVAVVVSESDLLEAGPARGAGVESVDPPNYPTRLASFRLRQKVL